MTLTKAIANIALIAATFGLMVGNMWFTYGLWPQSWVSLVLFALTSFVLMGVRVAIDKE